MSCTRYYLVCCDRCGTTTKGGMLDMRSTMRAARRVAKKQGWKRVPPRATHDFKGRDLCPTCATFQTDYGLYR